MGKYVTFYNIGIESHEGSLTTIEPMDIFDHLDRFQQNHANMAKEINAKNMRLFSFYSRVNRNVIVIPFGKFKSDKPYVVNQNDIDQIDSDLVDVNSLYYDKQEGICLITSNREAPGSRDIQDYINSFLEDETQYYFKLHQIFINTGLEKLQHAEMIRSLTFSLDLGHDVNAMYQEQIARNANVELPFMQGLRGLMESARDEINGNCIYLTMAVGTSRRDATMNLDGIVDMLGRINIDAGCIKEITATYKDGRQSKVDVAKLKNSEIELRDFVRSNVKQISPEVLLDNGEELIANKRRQFSAKTREYRRDPIQADLDALRWQNP